MLLGTYTHTYLVIVTYYVKRKQVNIILGHIWQVRINCKSCKHFPNLTVTLEIRKFKNLADPCIFYLCHQMSLFSISFNIDQSEAFLLNVNGTFSTRFPSFVLGESQNIKTSYVRYTLTSSPCNQVCILLN